ncbi:MAG: hypothetical protein ABIT96_13595 [Ferruginibacter sp.]
MKKTIVLALCLVTFHGAWSQKASVTWGEEFKLRKGSTDLDVIHTDADGVFVKESHLVLKSYFVIGATMREAATIIKLDKNLNEIYRQDFGKELKGKEFEDFFFLQDKLFLIASDYSKKDKTLTLFTAEVNKVDGELKSEFKEVASWQREEKADAISFRSGYNFDSTKMVLVSTIAGRSRNMYEVKLFDKTLKLQGKAINLSNEFDPKTYLLEDVVYTASDKVILVGRNFEYEEGKKKKSKFLNFSNYSIRMYDAMGKVVKEINSDINAKWLISTKVLQVPDKDLVLAAFYSNQKKGKEINGMLVQRFNPLSGEVVSTSIKELNTSQIAVVEEDDDDDDESKKERKEREKLEKIQAEEEGFSRYMRFRSFIITPDNGLVILAEKYNHYQYTTYSTTTTGTMTTTRSTTYDVHECGDLLMSRVEKNGDIGWLHVLPKAQKEIIQVSSSAGSGLSFSIGSNYFNSGFNRPFYAGFGILPDAKNVAIIFNDNKKNENVLQLGQKCRQINRYSKSECFSVQLDMVTGKYTRSSLFNNKDVPTAMPRLGSNLGNSLYIIGKEDRMLGKTKIAVARIALKG